MKVRHIISGGLALLAMTFSFNSAAQIGAELDVTFGAADPGVNTCSVSVPFCSPGGVGGLDSAIKVARWNWAATNNLIPRSNPPGPFSNSSQWFVTSNDENTNGIIDVGDTFSEIFTFRLVGTADGTGTASSSLGGCGGAPIDCFNHVFMTVVASGTITDTFDGTDIHTLGLKYTSAVFTMKFDPDADPGAGQGNGDEITIASFGAVTNPAGLNIDGVDGVTTLEWLVGWDCALTGVFELDGKDVTEGNGAGACAAGMSEVNTNGNEVLFKLTRQATTCPASGCSVVLNGGLPAVIIESQSLATGTSIIPPVPEPMTLSLMGLGLVGLGWASRRRKIQL